MDRPVFVFCANYPASPCIGTIFKFDLNTEVRIERVARFIHKPHTDPDNYVGLDWCVCLIDKEKLCLLPKWPCLLGEYEHLFRDGDRKYDKKEQVMGYIYDIKANKIVELNPPMCDSSTGFFLSLQGQIYWADNQFSIELKGGPSFQKYDMLTCRWEALPPVPWCGHVSGYAIFDDFSVFSTDFEGPCVYDLRTKKWYPISIEDGGDLFHGVGTVLENNTLYALKKNDDGKCILRILSISDKRETENVSFTCSILSDIKLPCYKGFIRTDFLAHLDDKAFLLLRIADMFQYDDSQRVEVVRFEVVDYKISNCTSELTSIPKRYGDSFIPMYSFLSSAIVSKDVMENETRENIILDLFRDTKLEPLPEKCRTKDLTDL